MSRKKQKSPKRAKSKRSSRRSQKRWRVTIDSKEAAVNFYSILFAFQQSEGGDVINKEAMRYINQWMDLLLEHDPDVEQRAHDTRGPFGRRDRSPLNISLELDYKERTLMLFIWKSMYQQLMTPKSRDNWIQNQGQEDYELAVQNYRAWIESLEGEGYISEHP